MACHKTTPKGVPAGQSGGGGRGFIDLFCGCGGLTLGFQAAGYKCLLAIDSDEEAIAVHDFNLSRDHSAARVDDLSEIRTRQDALEYLRRARVDPRECDVVVGGPPCQSYSVVGRNKTRALARKGTQDREYWRKRNCDRARLFEVFAAFVEAIEPRWFLFENVPAIRSHDAYAELVRRFEGIRVAGGFCYRLTPGNYVASALGVPQVRRRFILVGSRDDIDVAWRPPGDYDLVTVGDAIGDLPPVPAGHRKRLMAYTGDPLSDYQRWARQGAQAVYDHIGRWHNSDDTALFGQMAHGARFADPDVQEMLPKISAEHRLLKYSCTKFKDKLHKLDPTRAAWTVTAHLQKDCYKFIHHSQPRTITVREAARLQSFPDWFRFHDPDGMALEVSMVSSFRLLGNAVPPLLAQRFAESFAAADPELDGPTSAEACP